MHLRQRKEVQALSRLSFVPTSNTRRPFARNASSAIEARRVQRERQQGLGRHIISAEVNGTRFVATQHRIFHSRNWKTFHDFLVPYMANAVGAEWGNAGSGQEAIQ